MACASFVRFAGNTRPDGIDGECKCVNFTPAPARPPEFGWRVSICQLHRSRARAQPTSMASANIGNIRGQPAPRAGLAATHSRDVFYGYDLRGLQLFARFDSASGEGDQRLGRVQPAGLAHAPMDGTSRTLAHQYDVAGNRTRITWPDNLRFHPRGAERFLHRKTPPPACGWSPSPRIWGRSWRAPSCPPGSIVPPGRSTGCGHPIPGHFAALRSAHLRLRARSKRSAFMTLVQALTKSATNFS